MHTVYSKQNKKKTHKKAARMAISKYTEAVAAVLQQDIIKLCPYNIQAGKPKETLLKQPC